MPRHTHLFCFGLLLVLAVTPAARSSSVDGRKHGPRNLRQLLQASGAVADATPADVEDIVFGATIANDGAMVTSSQTPLPASAKGSDPAKPPKNEPSSEGDATLPKVQDRLSKKAAAAAITTPSERFKVIVTFKETPATRMPRFPKLNAKDPASKNAAKVKQAKDMADALVRNRHAHISAAVSGKVPNQAVKEVFVAGNIAAMHLTAADIEILAQLPNVERIEEDVPVEMPATFYPATNGNVNDDLEDARTTMNVDPYYNPASTGGVWIGLVDTGVRATHALLQGRLDWTRDCRTYTGYTPQSDCCPATSPSCATSGFGNQDGWCATGICSAGATLHGTAAASAITSNAAYGLTYRGMTAVKLDSYRIYSTSDGIRAIGAAMLASTVIVANIQYSDSSAVNTAANNAYNAGRAVIAASGNYGCSTTVNGGCTCGTTPYPGSVRAPASAHKAIAVGAANVVSYASSTTWGSPQPSCYSGRGPTPDGRIKPDILGLTDVEVGDGSADSALEVFTGTSCATPVAAGAAAALYALLGSATSPGVLYAGLIASGTSGSPYAGVVDNNRGAGILRLPTGVRWKYGSTTVTSTGAYVDIAMDPAVTNSRPISAAIWWPQEAGAVRNDVDLELFRTSSTGSTSLAKSELTTSVWEKVYYNPTVASANYFIRIRGFSLATGPQLVHYFIIYK